MKEWNFFEETVTVWSDSSAYFVELQIATPEAEKLESSIVIIAYTAP
jgi:hypothetical protein